MALAAASACGDDKSDDTSDDTNNDGGEVVEVGGPCDASQLEFCGGDPATARCGTSEEGADPECFTQLRAGPSVLILEDGTLAANDSAVAATVRRALVADGHRVIVGPRYHTWSGQPLPKDTLVVVLQGLEYGNSFRPGAISSLNAHVDNGGQVVRTEWAAYDIAGGEESAFDALLPLASVDGSYERPIEWLESDRELIDPALQAGVTLPFTEVDAGCSVLQEPTAPVLVLASNALCGPMVSVVGHGSSGGRVMHFNSDLAGEFAGPPAPEAVQLLVNSVNYLLSR